MSSALPWIGLAVFVIGLLLSLRRSEPSEAPPAATGAQLGLAALTGALLAGAGFLLGPGASGAMPAGLAGLVGVLLAALLRVLESRGSTLADTALPLALGGVATGFLGPQAPELREGALAGLTFGLAAGAWVLGGGFHGAILVGLIGVLDTLARRGPGDAAAMTAPMVALVAALVALASANLNSREAKSGQWRTAIAVAIGSAILAYLSATRVLLIPDAGVVFAAGALLALAVGAMVPENDQPRGLAFTLALVIWLSAAVWAFGLLRGYGMGLLTLGAAVTLAALKAPRALLTLGPVAALVVYRVFREVHLDASRALDIGQHYGLIGLIAGTLIPLAAFEWRREARDSFGTSVAAALWVPLLALLAPLAAATLASKGFVGVLAGLGMGSAVAGLSGAKNVSPLALSLGLGALMVPAFGWSESLLDLARNEKVSMLLIGAPILAVLAVAIFLLSRPSRSAAVEPQP